jgi:hypothetical protein
MLPNHNRNHLYRKFVVEEHGTLVRRNHVHIPECVVTFIRGLCPEPTGIYTGHRDVDDEGVQDVGNNESFEAVPPPQGNVGNINFENDELVT